MAPESMKFIEEIDRVYIDEASRGSQVATRVLEFFPAEKIEFVSGAPVNYDDGELSALSSGELSARQFNQSKRLLYLTPYQGHFFKRCPGATQKKALTCCNYHILNLGLQCNLNCSYCYLQSYINSPMMKIYSNIDAALAELKTMADQHPDSPVRVGTGEVIDSLSLDPLTLYSRNLIEFFNQYPQWTLEFKTKSANVDQFLDCKTIGNTVVSWSINPQFIITSEEHKTASLQDRLAAARKVRDQGFQVAFHIDPIIYHENWKENYLDLVEQLTSQFKASEVHVVSLGALRFQPEQRHMIKERFGMKSLVASSEMFPSDGGKLRYDQKLRAEMFKTILDHFKLKGPEWKVFLCMETPETWLKAANSLPVHQEGLRNFFRPLGINA